MDFRRNADRRRRVLREDLANSQTAQPTAKVQRIGRYDGRRTLQRQPKLIDLIPTSSWAIWPICVGAIFIAAGLIALNGNLPSSDQVSQSTGTVLSNSQLFQLSAPGSIAQTFLISSSIFSAIFCFQIYFVRRHRQDDYLGQYQIWRWLAGFFLCLSIGNLPWFKPLVSETFQSLTPDVYHNFSAKVLLGSGLFLLLGVGIRTFMEIKESVCSTFCIMTGTVLSALSILLLPELETGIHQIPSIKNLPTETSFGLWFLGNAFYFCSFTFYLSYVHKDVQGKLEKARAAKRRNKLSAKETAEQGDSEEKLESKQTTRQKSASKNPVSKTSDSQKSESAKQKTVSTQKTESQKSGGSKTFSSFDQLSAAEDSDSESSATASGKTKSRGRKRKNVA